MLNLLFGYHSKGFEDFGYIENSAISFAYLCYASTAQPLQQFEERRTATPNIYPARAAGKS